MKKLFVCLLATQLGSLNYAMQEDASNARVTLPESCFVKREIGRFVFEDFFTITSVIDQLAGKNKSKQEIVKILDSCADLYFKRIDQPAGRGFFSAQIDTIAQTLVARQRNLNNPTVTQHACKRHAQLATHHDLYTSSHSKL